MYVSCTLTVKMLVESAIQFSNRILKKTPISRNLWHQVSQGLWQTEKEKPLLFVAPLPRRRLRLPSPWSWAGLASCCERHTAKGTLSPKPPKALHVPPCIWHPCCGRHFTNEPGLACWEMARVQPPRLRDTQTSQLATDAWPGPAEMSWTRPGSTETSSWAQPELWTD